MAVKNPVKYESAKHRLFAPGDTVPAPALGLDVALVAGEGIQLTVAPDGTVTVINTCCEEGE